MGEAPGEPVSAKKPCACGQPGEYLCDALVPLSREERLRRAVAGLKVGGLAGQATCDAPLCEACRTKVSNTFVCGKNPRMDSMDYCPTHARGLPPPKLTVVSP